MSSKFNLPAELDIDESEDFTKDRIDQAFDYIVRRFSTLDSFRPQFEEQIGLLRTVGLQRLNQALEPVYQRVVEIANLGVMFTATVEITQSLSVGNKTFILNENERGRFAPASYLSAVPLDDTTKYMTGTLSSYNRATGELVISMAVIDGTGTFGNWRISAAANPAGLSYTTGEVDQIIANLVGGAGAGYQTLGQLQATLTAMKATIDAALSNKAPISSPNLTGAPTTTKPPVNDSSARIPTTSWVVDALSGAATSLAQQDVRGSEKHPWELRVADDQLVYQYGNTNSYGIYSTKYGSIWSVAAGTGVVTFGTRPRFGSAVPWDSDNFVPAGKANLTVYNTFTQNQEIQKAYPGLMLHYPNVKWWRPQVREDGRFYYETSDGNFPFSFGSNGSFSTAQVGDLLTALNARAALNTQVRFNGVLLSTSGEAFVYSDPNTSNIRLRSGNASSGYKYVGLNDDGTFQAFSGGFDSAGDVRASGHLRTNGRVIVGEGQTASWIEMRDLDEGTRYVHNNSGCIGFLGADGAWKLQVRDNGTIWTAQLGDIATSIGNRVAKTGDTMTGDLIVQKAYPQTRYLYPGVRDLAWQLRENGGMYLWDYSANTWNMYFGPNGEVSTRQLGDLNARIENRAAAFADDRASYRVNKGGDTMTGDLMITKGYPRVTFHYPNVKAWDLQVRENGWFYVAENFAQNFNFAFVPGGNLWSVAWGGYLTDYVYGTANERGSAWAATRQSQIGQNYDGVNRRLVVDGTLFIQGSAVVTLDGNGDSYVAFPWSFNQCDSVVLCNGDGTILPDYAFSARNWGSTGFVVRVQKPGAAAAGSTIRVNYTAMGR